MEKMNLDNFLTRKIIQQISIRQPVNKGDDYHDLKKKNYVLFVRKKVGEIKKKYGTSAEGKSRIAKFIKLTKQNKYDLNIEEILDINQDDPNFNKLGQKIIEALEQQEYRDDMYIESCPGVLSNKQKAKNKKQRSDISDRLKYLVLSQIDKGELYNCYQQFQREELKDKLNFLKKQTSNFELMKRRILKENQQNDQQRDEYFFNLVCSPQQLTVGKVLRINNEEIQYKQPKQELDEFTQARKQGKLTAMEQLNELIQQESQSEQKDVIKMYQMTKLEDINTDAVKNKINMITFKKKQQAQQKLQKEILSQNKETYKQILKDPETDPQRFHRENKDFQIQKQKLGLHNRLTTASTSITRPSIFDSQKFSSQKSSKLSTPIQSGLTSPMQLSSRPQTARIIKPVQLQYSNLFLTQQQNDFQTARLTQQSEASKMNNNQDQIIKDLQQQIEQSQLNNQQYTAQQLQLKLDKLKIKQKMQNFFNQCIEKSKLNDMESKTARNEINKLEVYLDNNLEEINNKEQEIMNKNPIKDPNFTKLKKENVFRRKLVQYLIDKVENKGDVVSKYIDHKQIEVFRNKLIQNSNK